MTPKKFLLMLLPFLAIISCWCLGMLVLIFLMAIQDTFDVELDLDFGFAFQVRNIQILPILSTYFGSWHRPGWLISV